MQVKKLYSTKLVGFLKIVFLISFYFFLLSPKVQAVIEPPMLNDPQLEQRYRQLAEVLRCPKCQNQNISSSDAPIATDMRHKVENLLLEGKSNNEIESYMIERYGDFVTYDPPLRPRTLVLWFAPLLFFGFIATCFWVGFRGRQGSTDE